MLESVAATEAFSEQHENEARQSAEFTLYLKVQKWDIWEKSSYNYCGFRVKSMNIPMFMARLSQDLCMVHLSIFNLFVHELFVLTQLN